VFFNSFDFLIFFVAVFVVQFVLPHRPRNLFLLAASYFFYGCWDWRFLGLMLLSTVIDFYCSHQIHKSEGQVRRKRLLTVSVLANLGVLGFFKYFNFFADSARELAAAGGFVFSDFTFDVILPVGISFYTFQTMSYTIDVYRGDMRPLQRFSDFALYVAFFPQLVAGPIERGTRLAPQIEDGRRTSWGGVQDGGWLVLKGLFKKAVIADNMAPIVDQVYTASNPAGPEVWLAMYAFAFQIYGDFSGYTDIARGVGRMMGYDLMLNFRMPYLATSPSDFWQRWHISLSSWLKDYLYIPLGGNRGGSLLTMRNLMLTMLLGGLWHGAAWTFVLWGAFHGLILIVYRLAGKLVDSPMRFSPLWWLQVAVMFHLTCFSWLIFRAESFTQLTHLLQCLTTGWAISGSVLQMAWLIGVLCAPLLLVHLLEEASDDQEIIRHLSLFPRTVAYTMAAGGLLMLGSFGGREFIYFQF
jgi:D-alanyl-lipoteichoic acid acyltransferase DltB (MBOAT superfamily)